MQKIVVGYNESPVSERALRRGIELAGFYQAKLVITSVVPVAIGNEPPSTPGPELLRAGETAAGLGVQPELVEAIGDPAEAIVEVAERQGADLVIVGTREPSQVERMLGQSVSEGVQRRAHCDVLIVH